MLHIRSHTTPSITAPLIRDARHQHPDWVHAQLGTESEEALQLFLDSCDLAEFAASPGVADSAGVYMTPEDAEEFHRETVEQKNQCFGPALYARHRAYRRGTTYVGAGEWYPVASAEEAEAIYGNPSGFPGGYEVAEFDGEEFHIIAEFDPEGEE